MKAITGKQLCKILESKGWQLKVVHGSHHVYTMSGKKERISVPVHANKDLKIGLLRAMMKVTDLQEEDMS